ncbi:MAG: hypothetical protein OEO84_14880 [Betaproteobacteria bacterium]|nr:hypothetical protein [Betaproteobacteria bacterium]
MRATIVALGIALPGLSSPHACADEFVYEVTAPRFKITIPNFPPLRMDPHPMQGTHPHLRFMGADGAFSLSIITATADAGMSALECASATARSLAARPNVPPAAEIYKARLNDNTFVAIYTARMPGFLQLHAHILSAAAGTHCIEVHASKIAASPDDIAPWFEGFA